MGISTLFVKAAFLTVLTTMILLCGNSEALSEISLKLGTVPLNTVR
jgi:hypothetical protein